MQNSQKGFIIPLIIVALAIIVGGGVWYSKSHNKVNVEKSAMTENNTDSVNNDKVKKDEASVDASGKVKVHGSLADLAKYGKDYECTFSSNQAKMQMDGHVFVSGENVAGEFKIHAGSAGVMTSHIITDKDFMYSWSSMMNQGFKKAKNTQATTSISGTPVNVPGNTAVKGTGSTNAQDFQNMYDYDCQVWNKDASVFVPPANISFRLF